MQHHKHPHNRSIITHATSQTSTQLYHCQMVNIKGFMSRYHHNIST